MSILKSYIRQVLLERVSEKFKGIVSRRVPLSAHFDIIPRVIDSDKQQIYKELKEAGIIKGFWDSDGDDYSTPEWLIFDKTENNINTFVEIIKKNFPKNIDMSLDEENIRSTLSDDFPLILGQAGGDYGKWLASSGEAGKKMMVRRNDLNVIGWAIHDIYHPNEGRNPEMFPSPRMSNDVFEWKGLGNDRKEVLNNIVSFLKKEGFTKKVGPDDVYASIWAYIVMKIDNEEQIKELKGLKKLSKEYFKNMLEHVNKFEEWLIKNKNKVFVNFSV